LLQVPQILGRIEPQIGVATLVESIVQPRMHTELTWMERLLLRQKVNPSKTVFTRGANALESGLAARP